MYQVIVPWLGHRLSKNCHILLPTCLRPLPPLVLKCLTRLGVGGTHPFSTIIDPFKSNVSKLVTRYSYCIIIQLYMLLWIQYIYWTFSIAVSNLTFKVEVTLLQTIKIILGNKNTKKNIDYSQQNWCKKIHILSFELIRPKNHGLPHDTICIMIEPCDYKIL